MAQAERRSTIGHSPVAAISDAASSRSDAARDALARNVRMLRAARRLSQVDLAADAGMTPGAVSMIEARKANPTMDTLERIARAFGVEVTALLADRAPKS